MNLSAMAHSVLFPVVTEIEPTDEILAFLDNGGSAILFGEYGNEYETGVLNPDRKERESADKWKHSLSLMRDRTDGLLASADADISAVNRFSHIAPELPILSEICTMETNEFEERIQKFGSFLYELGINMVLSPTADVVNGPNPWLTGRTLGDDISEVSRIVHSYVSSMQDAGVSCALKHFPGHPHLTAPLSIKSASVEFDLKELSPFLEPFIRGLSAGADAVLLSPVTYTKIDPVFPAPLSKALLDLLKVDLGFEGLVIACDIDHRSTQQNLSLGEVAVAALNRGSDLLILSPDASCQIVPIVDTIVDAVRTGSLDPERLSAASQAVKRSITRRKAI